MFRLKNKNDGFASLVEIIITTMLFVVAALGVYATIGSLAPEGSFASSRLQAAYYGKGVIDELRGSISAQTWDDPGGNYLTGTDYVRTFGPNNEYRVEYKLVDVPGYNGVGPRQLLMNVIY